MKVLTLSIKRKWFDEIHNGTKKTETREIRPNIAHRYIHYLNEETGVEYVKDTDIPDEEDGLCVPVPIKYDAIKLLTGAYNISPRPYIVIECTGADIVFITDDNDEPIEYEYEGRSYLMAEIDYHLGKILEDKSDIAKKVEDIMKERLADYGYSEADLSPIEMAEFRYECVAIAQGCSILDGVLETKRMRFIDPELAASMQKDNGPV